MANCLTKIALWISQTMSKHFRTSNFTKVTSKLKAFSPGVCVTFVTNGGIHVKRMFFRRFTMVHEQLLWG